MEVKAYLDQNKYVDEFDPKSYLGSAFCDPVVFTEELKRLVKFYAQFPDNKLQVLDYAGGPSLLHMIPAAPKASEIIFTDFLDGNLGEVKNWLERKSGAFDWTSAIEHCLMLEGQTPDKAKIKQRETDLREKIRAVIHCDLTASKIIEDGYEGPYDVINCTGLMDTICSTKEQFKDGIKNLGALIKKGGHLIINTDDLESYLVAPTRFDTPLAIEDEDIEEAYTEAGFNIVSLDTYITLDEYTLTIGQKK